MDITRESLAWLARRDGSVVVGQGPFESSATVPKRGVAFHVNDFALRDPQPWKIPGRVRHLSRAEFAGRFSGTAALQCQWQPLDTAPFSLVFQEVMASIQSGFFEKTVPVVTESGSSGCAPGPAILAAMARQEPPLVSYGWMHPDGGFAGATPESLFSLDGKRLTTMALAGTARSEDRDVFALDEKEIREHEYVAQTLVAKLLDLGHLERRAREILDLGSIVHFLTLIEVDLHTQMSAAELLRRLHPTPALGPLPRTDATMARLLEWRERLGCPPGFGAPFALWDDGRFDAVVAIRGVWWTEKRLRIPAGCGIIEASRLVNEWRELRLKREAVKRFLGE
ncbi:MAG: chorismate-binding protein [Luteolibacter sp.]|nr:chorismate-binding protein [Luteolibacter sp.]